MRSIHYPPENTDAGRPREKLIYIILSFCPAVNRSSLFSRNFFRRRSIALAICRRAFYNRDRQANNGGGYHAYEHHFHRHCRRHRLRQDHAHAPSQEAFRRRRHRHRSTTATISGRTARPTRSAPRSTTTIPTPLKRACSSSTSRRSRRAAASNAPSTPMWTTTARTRPLRSSPPRSSSSRASSFSRTRPCAICSTLKFSSRPTPTCASCAAPCATSATAVARSERHHAVPHDRQAHARAVR